MKSQDEAPKNRMHYRTITSRNRAIARAESRFREGAEVTEFPAEEIEIDVTAFNTVNTTNFGNSLADALRGLQVA